jgi:hypothetical protein
MADLMTAPLVLTQTILAACYDFLRVTSPFKAMRLPPSSEVVFRVVNDSGIFADFRIERGKPTIRVSAAKNGTLLTTLSTVGHEMKHLDQWIKGDREHHGPRFRRFAARAAAILGVDPKLY